MTRSVPFTMKVPVSVIGSGDSSDSVDSASPEKESLPPPSRGGNVIWIQSIAFDRKDELGFSNINPTSRFLVALNTTLLKNL